MAILETHTRHASSHRSKRLALAVADAGWFTTENLFRELRDESVAALLLKCLDYRNAWRRGERPWNRERALRQIAPNLWQRQLALPPGWMKTFPRIGMRPIARVIEHWQRSFGDARLALAMTYPHYLYLRDLVRPEISAYFNVDDYALYWPRHAAEIAELERRAVRESDVTVCVSHLRASELREAVPDAAGKIHHLPHGAPSFMLGDAPSATPAAPPNDLASLPRPLLGYIGSLEERIDWELLERLSVALPTASIVLIGRRPQVAGDATGWLAASERCLARRNVHAIGWRGQDTIAVYNRAFDVCLIPYRTDNPFNRACCPTKIMDYMATGRPIVATDLPECRLYKHLFDVAADTDGFLEAVRAVVSAGSDDGRAQQRFEHAAANSCARVAERFLSLLPV